MKLKILLILCFGISIPENILALERVKDKSFARLIVDRANRFEVSNAVILGNIADITNFTIQHKIFNQKKIYFNYIGGSTIQYFLGNSINKFLDKTLGIKDKKMFNMLNIFSNFIYLELATDNKSTEELSFCLLALTWALKIPTLLKLNDNDRKIIMFICGSAILLSMLYNQYKIASNKHLRKASNNLKSIADQIRAYNFITSSYFKNQDASQNNTCLICNQDNDLLMTNCGHYFHKNCLQGSIDKFNCPICG